MAILEGEIPAIAISQNHIIRARVYSVFPKLALSPEYILELPIICGLQY